MSTKPGMHGVVRANEQSDRMDAALAAANDAFWASIRSSFPEASSGDFPPDAALAFDNATQAAVERWIELNVPTVPTTNDVYEALLKRAPLDRQNTITHEFPGRITVQLAENVVFGFDDDGNEQSAWTVYLSTVSGGELEKWPLEEVKAGDKPDDVALAILRETGIYR